ncbi:ATP-dependent RNA helicase ddx24 [Allomyces arbusculus]|nr:ATP-dependent RNA helicase ddx24 [Allomyces arbusculus]
MAAATPAPAKKAAKKRKIADVQDLAAAPAPATTSTSTDASDKPTPKKARVEAKPTAKSKGKGNGKPKTKGKGKNSKTGKATSTSATADANDASSTASSDEALTLDEINGWGWREIVIPEGALLTGADDMGGFMCLEELSGVDVVTKEYAGRAGKQIVFKKTKSFKPVKSKAATLEEGLDDEMMAKMGFVHVDTVLPDDDPEVVKRLAREDAKRRAKEQQGKDDGSDDESDAADHVADMTLDSDSEHGDARNDIDGDVHMSDADLDEADEEEAEEHDSDDDGVHDAPTVEVDADSASNDEDADDNNAEAASPPAQSEPVGPSAPVPRPELPEPEGIDGMSAWTTVAPTINPWLLKGLADLGFTEPTAIQAQTLPAALMKRQNVVGAAETGSGKTLAFGLPILDYLASSDVVIKHPVGLILSPTRELAMQISDHLRAVIKPFSYSHKLNRVNVITLVGGFSEEKQRRLIASSPHIIVATPGRLWDLIESGLLDGDHVRNVPFFVLDEADKMLEKGKFKELENLIGMMTKEDSTTEWQSNFKVLPSAVKVQKQPRKRQMFVFSATLPTSGPTYSFRGKEITLKLLLKKLNLKTFETVDVTGNNKTTSNLIEAKIDCVPEEKDIHLYYLLTRYPGRTLVFVNSIASIRRLVPLLSLLRLPVYPLHAQMQQRQRMKNLERFAANENGILIASDVASRGLDIKNIEHVIHYQVPMTSDLYVHRSGRTARASASGLSIVLVAPKELPAYRKICDQLGKTSLKEFPIEHQYMREFRKRFNLARRIESAEHTVAKKSHDDSWLKRAAEALEVDLDANDSDEDEGERRKRIRHEAMVDSLKAELNAVLDKTILPKGTSKKYLRPELAQALNSATNSVMPASSTTATYDLKALRKKLTKKLP